MDYRINGIPGFESREIVLRPAGFFSGAQLFVDGEEMKGSWGKYTLRRNDGTEVKARLQSILIDPVPQLLVDGQRYQAVRPLEWYELFWAGWPIALMFVGGAIGAVCGVLAAYANSRIFRSDLQPVTKYLATATVSIAFVFLFVIILVFLSMTVYPKL